MNVFASSNSGAPVREAQVRNMGLGCRSGHRVQCQDESHSLGLTSVSRNHSVYPCIVTSLGSATQESTALGFWKETKINMNWPIHFSSTLNLDISEVYRSGGKCVADRRRVCLPEHCYKLSALGCSSVVHVLLTTTGPTTPCCPIIASLIYVPCLVPRGGSLCHLKHIKMLISASILQSFITWTHLPTFLL